MVLENPDTILQLFVYFNGNLINQCSCFLLCHIFAIPTLRNRLVFRYAYLIEFLQVRRIDSDEIDTVIKWNRRIGRLQQYTMVERQPTDITIEISVVAFHNWLRFLQI